MKEDLRQKEILNELDRSHVDKMENEKERLPEAMLPAFRLLLLQGRGDQYIVHLQCPCKGVDVRLWLEDTLKRIPTEKTIDQLLPCNWQVLPANSR